MGGGGGFSPIPIITWCIYGPETAGLVAMGLNAAEGFGSGHDNGAAQVAEAQRAAQEEASAAETAAEQRRRADRKRQEVALLAQTRAAHRADLAGADALGQTLGAPAVDTPQLKEKLGQ